MLSYSGPGKFGITCSNKMSFYSIILSITDRNAVKYDKDRNVSYYHIIAWADGRAPIDVRLPISKDLPDYASMDVPLDPKFRTQLWEMMQNSSRVSYSTPAGTVRVDTSDLPAAVPRFEAACKAMPRKNEPPSPEGYWFR